MSTQGVGLCLIRNICLYICWFRVLDYCELQKLLCTAVGMTDETILLDYISPFSQTQLVEGVMWQVQYVKRQGFRFTLQVTQCKQEGANTLPALKSWHYFSIRLSHLQRSQSTETVMLPNMSCDQFSQSCLAGGKIATGVYILPHEAK